MSNLLDRLRRRPALYWALAVAVAIAVARVAAALGPQPPPLGPMQDVAVAAHAVKAGTVLAGGDIRWRRWPAGLLPDTALVTDPVGQTAAVALVAGEPLISARLGRGGGLAVPTGQRALTVPVTAAAPPLKPGDRVDVLATFDTGDTGDGAPTAPVALGALVIDVRPDAVTVAVPTADAPKVAFAIAKAAITLALTSPT